MSERPIPETREARRFGIILAGLLAALAAFAYLRHHYLRAEILAGAALLALMMTLAAPGPWLAFFRLWMRITRAISWIMTRILLSLFFYLILTPVGLIARSFRKDPLDLAWRDGRKTYWKAKEAVDPDLERYQRPF